MWPTIIILLAYNIPWYAVAPFNPLNTNNTFLQYRYCPDPCFILFCKICIVIVIGFSHAAFTPSLLHNFTSSLLHSFTTLLLHSFTPSLLHSFTPSLLHSYTSPLFTSSLLHSFTQPNISLIDGYHRSIPISGFNSFFRPPFRGMGKHSATQRKIRRLHYSCVEYL